MLVFNFFAFLVLLSFAGIGAIPGRLNVTNRLQSVSQMLRNVNKKRQLDSNSLHQQLNYHQHQPQSQQQQHPQSRSIESGKTNHAKFTVKDDVELQNIENELTYDCPNCADETITTATMRWTMPLLKLGEKRYYLGIFFKANWYRASQYCRYHGMHLASINSQEENDKLEKHIKDFGLGHEHFWTSGTDQGEEGTFFWMANGRPVSFENWNTGEPNNFRYENNEEEHCLELWNRDGKGLKWNDSPCSFETYFVCEIQ